MKIDFNDIISGRFDRRELRVKYEFKKLASRVIKPKTTTQHFKKTWQI